MVADQNTTQWQVEYALFKALVEAADTEKARAALEDYRQWLDLYGARWKEGA